MGTRGETVVLVALTEDVKRGRALPDRVNVDGIGAFTMPFLSGLPSRDLDMMRDALGLPEHASPVEVATAYDKRRRRGTVDESRPYLDQGTKSPLGGDVLLHFLAERLSRGGPIPARVHPQGDAEPMTLRDYLDTLASDRLTPATLSGPKLGLEAGASVMVAAVTIRGKLERAGLLEKMTTHPALARFEKQHA